MYTTPVQSVLSAGPMRHLRPSPTSIPETAMSIAESARMGPTSAEKRIYEAMAAKMVIRRPLRCVSITSGTVPRVRRSVRTMGSGR